ncbi:CYFA0S07e03994g1_1 [Cyberlindnera fabianii]|uniref:RNA helicase n=1 Tax=Cyberlindnera fabianii TaxID=36022 RepID=A0A061AVE7_CYBFA|nr:CYFA0S07e03994g1_1 [Cyberlindnera fabianii]
MGKYRPRFNEKARAGMLAKQEKLKKARQKQFYRHLEDGTETETQPEPQPEQHKEQDPNAEILQPMTAEEREAKKRKLEEQLKPEKETKMSRQKKKRLEKYIDHQLKREEKKVLIEKLNQSSFDTSLLKSSKLLGTGKQTRKEEFAEALSLEKQGRASDKTNEILYEKREVRDWDQDMEDDESGSASDGDEDNEDKFGSFGPSGGSGFIDMRPAIGGMASGFGFANATKIKRAPKKKYTWRAKVEQEDLKKSKNKKKDEVEDERDFESSEDDSDMGSLESNSEAEEQEEVESIDEDVEEEEDNNASEDEESPSQEESEDESEEEPLDTGKFTHTARADDFKQWADEQIRKLEGREKADGVDLPNYDPSKYERVVRPEDLEDDLKEEYIPIDENSKRKAFFVTVNRPDEIQETRMQLPVFGEEHRIMEAIHHNDTVIICGETGSGKTTQVPQFLYEAGYGSPESPENPGMIGITQPRRVAAVSMANRVSNELGDHGDKVSYQIRFDSTTKSNTRMKFMTDGVLLREMMTDFILEKYSSIIIDEAHERNINTDILIGMLSRVVRLRRKLSDENPAKYKRLKLIIMSATLRVSDFSENTTLFETPPPILEVQARQYPVSIHFNKRTVPNYIDEAFRKTCKIHQKLPPGGILIFMTGQNEITGLVKRLRNEFPFPEKKKKGIKSAHSLEDDEIADVRISAKHADTEAEDIDFSVKVNDDGEEIDDGDISDLDGDDEEEGFDETLEEGQTDRDPLYVLPFYSLLPTKEQMKVFNDPPKGSRLCIVATNVAETSLTIPGIRYVVDAGRSKERKYDMTTGVQSYEIDWVSKASANQRAGRAGRTGPGHCYRLYSSAVFERDFPQFSIPEILRMPIESVVLTMKSMGIHQVVNFPFPTPPERPQLHKAEKLLQVLGALTQENKITELGKNMSLFPMSPRFAKMLMLGNQRGCMPYVVAIVSALSVGDPFINENELGIAEVKKVVHDEEGEEVEQEPEDLRDVEAKRKLRSKYHSSRQMFGKLDKYSDLLRVLSVVCAFDWVKMEKQDDFLSGNFLRPKIMEEIKKLRKQVTYIVKSLTTKENVAANVTEKDLKVGLPKDEQVKLLKQVVAAGFVDHVAIRADLIDPDTKLTSKTDITNIPYVSVTPTKGDEEGDSPFVYIHPSSIMCTTGEVPPSYIVYESVTMGANNNPDSATLPKRRMRSLCNITAVGLANVAKNSGMITYSKPLGPPYAPKLLTSTKRECYVVPRYGALIGNGGVGWDLKPLKVIQNRVNGKWVNE